MLKKLFYELDEEKRERITNVVLREFAQYSYNESSTNRIVKNAGIGKGSLFKYFQNKQDMYFYILDYIINDLAVDLKDEIANLPGDLFVRTIKYAELEFTWYIQNPDEYKLLKRAFVKNDTEIYKETKAKYASMSEEYYYKLFEDINMEQFQFKREKKKLLDILKWLLKGFNEEFIEEVESEDNINSLKDEYLRRLVEYIEILKEGLK